MQKFEICPLHPAFIRRSFSVGELRLNWILIPLSANYGGRGPQIEDKIIAHLSKSFGGFFILDPEQTNR